MCLVAALASSLIVLWGVIAGQCQKMRVMNWVRPITALYVGPIAPWSYWRCGRPASIPDGGDPHSAYIAGTRERRAKST